MPNNKFCVGEPPLQIYFVKTMLKDLPNYIRDDDDISWCMTIAKQQFLEGDEYGQKKPPPFGEGRLVGELT